MMPLTGGALFILIRIPLTDTCLGPVYTLARFLKVEPHDGRVTDLICRNGRIELTELPLANKTNPKRPSLSLWAKGVVPVVTPTAREAPIHLIPLVAWVNVRS